MYKSELALDTMVNGFRWRKTVGEEVSRRVGNESLLIIARNGNFSFGVAILIDANELVCVRIGGRADVKGF